MESTNKKKKWITLLLTATMSVALLFGATACNDNDGNTDIIVEDNSPDIVVPEGDGDGGADLDVDVDVESEAPASPSAS
jgi:3-dehydroquinate synthase class II